MLEIRIASFADILSISRSKFRGASRKRAERAATFGTLRARSVPHSSKWDVLSIVLFGVAIEARPFVGDWLFLLV